jgi:hypothetical protein
MTRRTMRERASSGPAIESPDTTSSSIPCCGIEAVVQCHGLSAFYERDLEFNVQDNRIRVSQFNSDMSADLALQIFPVSAVWLELSPKPYATPLLASVVQASDVSTSIMLPIRSKKLSKELPLIKIII